MRRFGGKLRRPSDALISRGLLWIGLIAVCSSTYLAAVGTEHRDGLDAARAVDQAGVHQTFMQDPCLGFRWTVAADPDHPQRPPHMVLAESGDPVSARLVHSQSGSAAKREVASLEDRERSRIVIHPGDLILINQDSQGVRAIFEGNALNSAARGDTFRVRLRFGTVSRNGGIVIDVVATQVGRAQWMTALEEGQ